MNEYKEKIKSGYRLPCPSPLQDDIKNGLYFYDRVIRICWVDKTWRPGFKYLVQMLETFMQEEEKEDFQEPEQNPQVSLSNSSSGDHNSEDSSNIQTQAGYISLSTIN